MYNMLTTYAGGAIVIIDFAHGLKHNAYVLLVILGEPLAIGNAAAFVETTVIFGGGDDTVQHPVNLSWHNTKVF